MPNTYETKLWGGRFRGDEDALMQHFNSECWRTSWLVEPLTLPPFVATNSSGTFAPRTAIGSLVIRFAGTPSGWGMDPNGCGRRSSVI